MMPKRGKKPCEGLDSGIDAMVTSGTLPNANCQLCLQRDACAGRAELRQPDGGCFVALRRQQLDSIGGLLESMRREAGLAETPFKDSELWLLAHMADAMARFSGLLEFSASLENGEASAYRYSYSFPGFGHGDAERELRACRRLLSPFGDELLAVADRLLGLARPGVVSQLLMGIDARRGQIRHKLYYQMSGGRLRDTLWLLSRLLGKDRLREPPEPYDRLHLVGVDFDRKGVLRVKLYFMYPFASREMLLARFGGQSLVRALLNGPCSQGLKDFLTIWRVDAARAGNENRVSELDFSLIANNLLLDDLHTLQPGFTDSALDRLWRRLARSHRLVPTRVSLRPDSDAKLNLYYLAFAPKTGRD